MEVLVVLHFDATSDDGASALATAPCRLMSPPTIGQSANVNTTSQRASLPTQASA
jgi:hypothetical protein